MKRAPTRSAIFAAERKLVQSRRDTVDGFSRLRSALRSGLTRPASLAAAVGLTALIGFWLVRRNKPRTTQARNGTSTSMAGIATALLIRFGWQRLSGFLRDSWASRQEHPAAGVPPPDEHLRGPARQG